MAALLGSLVGRVILLPVRLTAGLLCVLRLTGRQFRGPRLLPVGGIDEVAAQHVLSALREHGNHQTASAWLRALQLAQIASDRLYCSRTHVLADLKFWQARMSSGRHRAFMLFNQGPVRFAKQLLSIVRRPARRARRAAAQIDAKITALRLIDAALLEGLATVHLAAAALAVGGDDLVAAVGAVKSGVGDDDAMAVARDVVLAMEQRTEEVAHAVAKALHGVLVAVAAADGTTPTPTPDTPSLAATTTALLHAGVSRSAPWLHRQWQAAQLRDGTALLHTLDGEAPAGEALSRAAVVAAAPASIVPLPASLRAPSRLQRHWLAYSAAGVACAWALSFLYRHSSLSGSDDLSRWSTAAVNAVRTAVKENVEKPLVTLQGELFKTFRDRSSIVSRREFETDREALVRMLDDFKRDKTGRSLVNTDNPRALRRTESDMVADGMAFLMRSYEDQLVNPLRNLVTGDLARSLLIQVQKVKVDTEAAMLEIDQILRANELSISLVAAVPAILIAYGIGRGLWRVVTPSAPDPVWEALPARLAMIELERSIGKVVSHSHPGPLTRLPSMRPAAPSQAPLADEGVFVYNLARVYVLCRGLFLRHGMVRQQSEWPQLKRDLLELGSLTHASHRRDVALRMMRSYTIFQQFRLTA